MKTADLRQAFLSFFESKNHTIVESSSLVPGNDPTLLFTNAGMVQFKDVFLGQDKRAYSRATTSQKCVRAGGKHNDLENVGFTKRHLTFFEMLGNFSFGDYFKEDAIKYGWEFVTQTLNLPKEKLWVTVFNDDDEAFNIWHEQIGVPKDRIIRCGEKDNFWSMGDTGPCGPCSEIFYDHGPEVAGGPPGSPDEDGDRYVEIWNLVFMQYNRDSKGKLTPLPKPSVDTGMGLERIAAVMQGVHSNFETDMFLPLIKQAAAVLKCNDLQHNSLKVIADHLRSCAFLVADGVIPSNEGRGYVLRRIMRRAIRHGRKLDYKDTFMHKLVGFLVREMGQAYPQLTDCQAQIEQIFKKEEEQFAKTLEQGLALLEDYISKAKDNTLAGDAVFKLYDTYGFPADLTQSIAQEKNVAIDMAGFDVLMQKQKASSKGASNFVMQEDIKIDDSTDFLGYENISSQGKVVKIIKGADFVDSANTGEEVAIVLDKTPFYAESGGQVGDFGTLILQNAKFKVQDTQKTSKAFLHYGVVEAGSIKLCDLVEAKIDSKRRDSIRKNHSATHLLHAALREVLGSHVTQKGSVVDEHRLRFDFSHFEPISTEQLVAIEDLVNQKILDNTEVKTEVLPIEEAKSRGAMALFGEKYDDKVRVLSMGGDFSIELCGGTHTKRTGDIGLFKITQETGIAAGVRRVEAITGFGALTLFRENQNNLQALSSSLKTTPEGIADKVNSLQTKVKSLEKELDKTKLLLASGKSQDFISQAKEINGIKILAVELPTGDAKTLREAVDNYKNKLGSGVVVLAVKDENKVSIAAGVTKDLAGSRVHAGKLINAVAQMVGGKGGGRPDMAQAGGSNPDKLDDALKEAYKFIEQEA